MTSERAQYWLHAVSPLHVGSGRGEGYIDLPLQREKATQFPIVPGTAVKGVLRDYYEKLGDYKDESVKNVFGTPEKSGDLVFTDARLVCLPLASIYGTFAWCSSALVLRRLARDLEMANLNSASPSAIKKVKDQEMEVSPQTPLAKCVLADGERNAYLEDLEFKAVESSSAGEWARWIADHVFPHSDDPWRAEFRQRFAVLNDDVFSFLCQTATEVQAHICIDDEYKRVKKGALWYEEYLPAETILAGLSWCDNFGELREPEKRKQIIQGYCPPGGELDLQIGGNATVGKGRVRCVFSAPNSSQGGKS